jgi:hypothetical protein
MRVVGTAGASAAAKPARGTPRPERSAAALAPSFGAHSRRGLVVHWTINEGPALGRARGKHLDSPIGTAKPRTKNQKQTNVVSSRARSPESRRSERHEISAKISADDQIRGVLQQQGSYEGALMKKWPSTAKGKRSPRGIIVVWKWFCGRGEDSLSGPRSRDRCGSPTAMSRSCKTLRG